MVIMNYKIIALLMLFVVMMSGAYAYGGYSGYNEYYYTNNYKPNVYYQNPYQAAAYNPPSYYGAYNQVNYYNTPTAYYQNVYTPYYGYGPRVMNYSQAYYTYPSSYRSLTFYKGDSGWGLSIGSGNVCGLYGYC